MTYDRNFPKLTNVLRNNLDSIPTMGKRILLQLMKCLTECFK